MWDDFRKFAMRGNVIDLAVGVIIGGAFGKIVTSLVSDLMMPLIGLLLGGINLSGLQIKFGSAAVHYGAFLQNVVDFLIISFAVYLFVRAINRFRRKEQEKPAAAGPSREELLLTEIRDLLRQQRG